MAMYGYGYRYPRAPRITYYEDPNYRFKWTRAAIGNRAIAAKSPWIAHLKQSGVFDTIRDLLRKEALEYRKKQGGVKESTKKGAKQRIVKLNRAIAALKDENLLKNVAEDLGDKYKQDNVTATIARLEAEIKRLQDMLEWKPGQGYGLMSGLGYGEGYGEGYGYFY